jgi:hypothetical protein
LKVEIADDGAQRYFTRRDKHVLRVDLGHLDLDRRRGWRIARQKIEGACACDEGCSDKGQTRDIHVMKSE